MKTIILKNVAVNLTIDYKEKDIVGVVKLSNKARRLLLTGEYIIAPALYIDNGKYSGIHSLSIIHNKKYKGREL